MNTIFLLIVFLPLIGALIAGVFGPNCCAEPRNPQAHDEHHHGPAWPQLLPTALLLMSAALSWIAFFDVAVHEQCLQGAKC